MTKHMHSAAEYMVRLEGEIDPAQLMNGVRSNS
jgi:hypothetical protein